MRDLVTLVDEILRHPSGVAVDLFGGLLTARKCEDGSFIVEWIIRGRKLLAEGEERSFVSGDSVGCATFFVAKREELRLGYDFEASPRGYE